MRGNEREMKGTEGREMKGKMEINEREMKSNEGEMQGNQAR